MSFFDGTMELHVVDAIGSSITAPLDAASTLAAAPLDLSGVLDFHPTLAFESGAVVFETAQAGDFAHQTLIAFTDIAGVLPAFSSVSVTVDGPALAVQPVTAIEHPDELVVYLLGAYDAGTTIRLEVGFGPSATDDGDVLRGTVEADRLFGLGGADRLVGLAGDDTLTGGTGADRLSGGAGEDDLEGGHGRDVLRGGDDDDVLMGEAGRDRLLGQGGDDVLRGGLGQDRLFGGAGDDQLSGTFGNDVAHGGAGDDEFTFEGGRNQLFGGAGDDQFRLGVWFPLSDTAPFSAQVSGGAGADLFGFQAGTVWGSEGARLSLLDFDRDEGDRIDLSPIDAVAVSSQRNDAFAWRGRDGLSGEAGELAYDRRTGRLLLDDDGDGRAEAVIRLAPGTKLWEADLIL
ncbi:MAG: calcium-binding protein [Pseudomonadota bacterium]